MKKVLPLIACCLLVATLPGFSQLVDSIKFFTDEKVIGVTLTTDIRSLQNQKGEDQFQDAAIVCRFPDSTVISEKVQVTARGNFRRGYCRIPPMAINFRTPGAPRLASLG